jgi:hypothetical protein
MSVITNNSFQNPVIGTDPVTKGTFTITWANMLFDFDDDELDKNSRASGTLVIDGFNNPLFDAIKANPLRTQGLVASVMFGSEKKFIRFSQITDYSMQEDGIVNEIELSLIFDILDNLEYLENVIEYKDNNLL